MSCKTGFNSFQLKLIALILMTFDHIHYFGSTITVMPAWLHILGRISAPLFLFILAQGMYYTSNRFKYLLRLYLASLLMAIGNILMNDYFPLPGNAVIINNIFATMFLCGIYICAIEWMAQGIKQKQSKAFSRGLLFFLLPIISTVLMLVLVTTQTDISAVRLLFIRSIALLIPSPLFVEGSVAWIVLGVAFYFLRSHKTGLTVFYSLLSLFFLYQAAADGITLVNLFVNNPQWFMIAALPFMLLYNQQKGRSMKYLFYLYYPLHIYVLALLAHLAAS